MTHDPGMAQYADRIVTHDPGIAQYADRIVTLADGNIIGDERKERKSG